MKGQVRLENAVFHHTGSKNLTCFISGLFLIIFFAYPIFSFVLTQLTESTEVTSFYIQSVRHGVFQIKFIARFQ